MSNQTNDVLGRLIEVGVESDTDEHQYSVAPRTYAEELEVFREETRFLRTRSVIWGALIALFVFGLAFVFGFEGTLADWSWSGTLPKNPTRAADKILAIAPVLVSYFGLVPGNGHC
jgi:hypothetical protein